MSRDLKGYIVGSLMKVSLEGVLLEVSCILACISRLPVPGLRKAVAVSTKSGQSPPSEVGREAGGVRISFAPPQLLRFLVVHLGLVHLR